MTPKAFRKRFETGHAARGGDTLIDDLNAAFELNDRLRRMLKSVLTADRRTGGLAGIQARIRAEFPDLENT